jgi:hypothetical protein
MNLKDNFTFLVISFYVISLSGHDNAVVSQYPSYYSEFENSINTDDSPYYPIKSGEHKDSNSAKENINTVKILFYRCNLMTS